MSDAITAAEFTAGPGVAGWRVLGRSAVVRYGTGSFATGVRFVMRIGVLAEAANHHPDVDLRFGSVTVRTTSHDIGGLSRRDLALAQEISAAARELSIQADPSPWAASDNPDDGGSIGG
ncbi:4a-hydroxytetrahydrobiopterin dehydratase [Promicromonospora thailandica]|uniref:Putative pterin-4-alpha-carbinolamine dehydratase n=1 Tax=Promicromonospora thailandica TaxID=765201 RepID=A0A9X2G871_9MICO|nr:4a-hydroxytetrahydrobiopterin dehydratase [Promicromonospora thailandica]MCP2267358.1 4a-hydroxytetrahydrobiopterin dehydratase [Promicromonospora thailandica]